VIKENGLSENSFFDSLTNVFINLNKWMYKQQHDGEKIQEQGQAQHPKNLT
jgi:hypothetical protein